MTKSYAKKGLLNLNGHINTETKFIGNEKLETKLAKSYQTKGRTLKMDYPHSHAKSHAY